MKVVLWDSTVGTLVEFLVAAANQIDAGGTDMGHMFSPEPAVGRRGVQHGAFKHVPVDILN